MRSVFVDPVYVLFKQPMKQLKLRRWAALIQILSCQTHQMISIKISEKEGSVKLEMQSMPSGHPLVGQAFKVSPSCYFCPFRKGALL